MPEMLTLYGAVDVFRLRPEDINLDSIAHSLAHKSRWNGHARQPYTVAQHSHYVANLAWDTLDALPARDRAAFALSALMHDAAESFTGDIPRPLKDHLFVEIEKHAAAVPFRRWEHHIHLAIAEAFNLPALNPHQVDYLNWIDNLAAAVEARSLLGVEIHNTETKKAVGRLALPPILPAWRSTTAKTAFLDAYRKFDTIRRGPKTPAGDYGRPPLLILSGDWPR